MKSDRYPTLPLRRVGTLVGGGTPRSDEVNWNGCVPFVTPPDLRPVTGGRVVNTDRTLTEIGVASGSSVVPADSVLLSIRAPIGYVARAGMRVAFNQGCRAILPGAAVNSRYLTYALVAAGPELESLGRGTTFMELSATQMAGLEVPVPELDEQCVIADYLDRETARIDTLIAEQQRLVETLRERRKAVVEKAVFSGLDIAPTQSNSESWLPPTPPHWQIAQLGFVSDTLAGYAFPSDGFSDDEDHVRLLRGVNVKPGRVDWADTVYWDVQAAAVPSEFCLDVGDLVFGMDRPFVGGGVRVAAISESDLPALLLQRVMRIRPSDEAGRGYMAYVMSTDSFLNYLEPLFTGVSVPHVSEWQVRKFKMPSPPVDEQKRISAHLDKQTAKIDTLVAETERFIELCLERRSALITAAVTGQIDVREMV